MVPQVIPNPPKWGPKAPLKTPKSWKKWKSEISQKPLFFVWFQHIRASNSGMISIPKSLKNQHWHLDHPFEIPNHVNTQKLIKIWSPGGSQNPSKIIKNSLVDPKVPSWMSPGTPWPPTGAKMMSQGVKMESQGLQNHRFGYSRSHQSHKSASPALQVNRLPKGPAAGGNALRIYIYIYIYIYILYNFISKSLTLISYAGLNIFLPRKFRPPDPPS